ncbi:hypothetical protein LWC34_08325 [Kibdelosporangium philippinense]|uniref:Fe/B12 periplasmic-binding domain-containing protein n=1 Tax=Kibdelosporangium philippinense TaxID=211113 RepID=A0ABS8Z4R7_9PSEU|nr:hypothetical protein [Kibdelosporangium philippinense]MCE7002835.1 hypothetical protein [Kibdelosporangium philippinense]
MPLVLAGALLTGRGATSQEATPTGMFSVTIKTAFGDAVIKQKPQRVVALGLGLGDIAIANALGANIVGAVKNYTGDPIPYLQAAGRHRVHRSSTPCPPLQNREIHIPAQ